MRPHDLSIHFPVAGSILAPHLLQTSPLALFSDDTVSLEFRSIGDMLSLSPDDVVRVEGVAIISHMLDTDLLL